MKTGLNVGERLLILSILPKEGNFITLRVIQTLKMRIGLSAEEYQKYEIVSENGGTRFNIKGLDPTDFEFAEVEADIIKSELKKKDTDKKLTEEMITIYEKFCV